MHAAFRRGFVLFRDDGQSVAGAAVEREDGLCAIRWPAGPDCGSVAKPAGDFVAALLEPAGVEVLGYKVRRVGLAGVGEKEAEGSHGDFLVESATGAL